MSEYQYLRVSGLFGSVKQPPPPCSLDLQSWRNYDVEVYLLDIGTTLSHESVQESAPRAEQNRQENKEGL